MRDILAITSFCSLYGNDMDPAAKLVDHIIGWKTTPFGAESSFYHIEHQFRFIAV
jgi:hypothetical protein